MDKFDSGRWELATTRAEFLDLRDDWESLFNENPQHSPFLAWGWVDAWLRHLAKDHELQIAILRNSSGGVRYILPLHRLSRGIGANKLMLVCGYGLECSDNLGCLCAPDLEDRSANLTADAIDRFFDVRDILSLGFLDNSSQFPSRLLAAMQASGRFVKIREDALCPAVELPADWNDYLKRLSSNFRSQVRRSCRYVGGDDQPHFEFVDPDNASTFTSELIELNRSRFQSQGRQSSLETNSLREFLGDAVPYMASNGHAWMDAIVHERETLASALHFVHGKTVSFYMGGFLESASRIRPGTALFAHVIQRGIENGFTRYDFLRGDEAYKYRWRAADVNTHEVAIYGAGLMRGRVRAMLDDGYLFGYNLLKNIYKSVKRER